MKKDPTIRESIDESLCAVRFNAQDERNVMAAIHGRRVRAKKRARRLNLAFAAGLLLLLVLPVSAFTLHTRRLSAVNAAAPGEDRILSPDATPEATAARSPLATANAAASGALEEAWCIGTAAVISPIGELSWGDRDYKVNDNKIGALSQKLYDELTGIQWGTKPDPFGWVCPID